MVKKFIQNNKFFLSICVRLRNKLKVGKNACSLNNIQNSGNEIFINGEKNVLSVASRSVFRECGVQINGINNRVDFAEGSNLYGENKNTIYVCGNDNEIIVGKNVSLRNVLFFIRGNGNRIVIGDNCSAIYAQFHVEQNENEIIIGNGATMNGRGHQTIHMAVDEGSRIIISEDCMIAHSVQMRSTDSHSIVDLEGNRLNPAKDIIIGHHCWIGLQCIILKGTQVPEHCVVAAGSVCSKVYFEKNCVIAGNPAKTVKHNIDWDRKFV